MIKFLRRYNELLLGPLGALLWVVSPQLIHWLDPTAAVYDAAVWQKVIFGLVLYSICSFSTWLMIRLQAPHVFKYLTEHFDEDFGKLSEDKKWDKLRISLCYYALHLLGFLLSMQVL